MAAPRNIQYRQDIVHDARYYFQSSLPNLVIRTVKGGLAGEFREVVALARAIHWAQPQDIAAVHRKLASGMHQSVKASYRQAVEVRRSSPSYLRSNRFGGGALRRVIDASDFVVGDSEGISYVNVGRLRTEAKHWKRLNFGAGDAAGPEAGRFPLRFGDTAVGAPLGFTIGHQPGFTIPKGFFLHGERRLSPQREFRGAGASRPFFPRSREMLSETVGIRARHFLDAGLRRLARDFGPQYELFMRNQIQRGTPGGRAARRELVKITHNPFL